MTTITPDQGNQHSPDYERGFAAGAIHAEMTKGPMMGRANQFFCAYSYYVRERGVLSCADFLQGWQDGYKAWFAGIL